MLRRQKGLLYSQPKPFGEFFFGGQVELVGGSKDLPVFLQDGILDDRLVFAGAEDNAEGGVVAFSPPLVFIQAHVHVHLPDIAVGELAHLEVYQDKTFEQKVVEGQVDVELLAAGGHHPFLPANKSKALAQFH